MKSNNKFLFNPETLQYESVGKSVKRTLKRLGSFLIFSFIIAAAYYFVYSFFFDTLKEYSIKRENKILSEHLVSLNERYKKLDEVIFDISKRDTNIYSVIFEAKPLDLLINDEIESGRYEFLHLRSNSELILLASEKLDLLTNSINRQSVYIDSLKKLVESKQDKLEFIPSILPINNLDINAVGASVGDKINPIHKSLHVHTGIDFAVPVGSEVVATASGTVQNIISKKFSTGTEIIINHENDYETRYLYLDTPLVKKGEKVKQGEVIGIVGNIGMSVPHLHYEVRMGGKIADPLNYFFRDLSPQKSILFATVSLSKGQSLD
ncbi:MAG: M23 family metallopeptidase [Prevotellaceae bacterium]|jgi:hypothetical protein|nr:M23 family metallopeptidase [Prevotellaceae bacterium]